MAQTRYITNSLEIADDFQQSNIEPNDFTNSKKEGFIEDKQIFRHADVVITNQNKNTMLIEDAMNRPNGYKILNSDQMNLENNDNDIRKLQEKLLKVNRTIQKNQEEHKAQILHIETISMMTKYQLVFIKMETSLIKLANIIKNRERSQISVSFTSIKLFSRSKGMIKSYKKNVIYNNFKQKIAAFIRTLHRLRKTQLNYAFNHIQLRHRFYRFEKKIKEEKDKITLVFNETLATKEKEISNINKKLVDTNALLSTSKNKQNDLLNQIKQKEKLLTQIENEKNDILKSKRVTPVDKYEEKQIEAMIREMQKENEDLREKILNTEGNVGNFIKEMSELLDLHELSTNIGSEENNSFIGNNGNDFGLYDLNEEYEQIMSRSKDKSTLASSTVNKGMIKQQQQPMQSHTIEKNSTNRGNINSSNTGRYVKNN